MIEEKALFIALMTKYYRQFEAGEKHFEMRAYGPRWNEKTCRPGRRVTLSHGYMVAGRIPGTVFQFLRVQWCDVPEKHRAALRECKIENKDIAFIGINPDGQPPLNPVVSVWQV